MKKHTFFNNWNKIIYLLSFAMLLVSCAKTEYIQEFDDIFDVSGVNDLNQKIEIAETLDDLSGVFDNLTFQVSEEIKNIGLDFMVDHYNRSIQLSSTEIDLLLKNDPNTYLNIINRFGSLPTQIGDLNLDFTEIKSSTLNKYLIIQKQDIKNFYSDDYYSAVIAMQDFIKSSVIEPMSNLKTISNLKSSVLDVDDFSCSIIIICSYDMRELGLAFMKGYLGNQHAGGGGHHGGGGDN